MKLDFMIKAIVGLGMVSFLLCVYLNKHNTCMALNMQIPKMIQEIKTIEADNAHLSYQIECFENPQNLLCVARSAQFAHLQFPPLNEILAIRKEEIVPLDPQGTLQEKLYTHVLAHVKP